MAMCNRDEPCTARSSWGYCRLKGTRIERDAKEKEMFHGKYKVKIAWKKNVHQLIIVPTFGIITYDPSNWDWYEYIPQFSIAFSWLFFAFKIQLDKLSAFANTLPCHRKETMLNMDVTD